MSGMGAKPTRRQSFDYVLTPITALGGKWSGGWHVEHLHPFALPISRQKRPPRQQAHQSPCTGSSAEYDHLRAARTVATACGDNSKSEFGSGAAANGANPANRPSALDPGSA